jgi:Tfp pilus assembly protein PilF
MYEAFCGKCLALMGKFDTAETHFKTALSLIKEEPSAPDTLARAHTSLANFYKFIRKYD